jgi:hypothetical protein
VPPAFVGTSTSLAPGAMTTVIIQSASSLSGGAIAGIVIGSIVGTAVLLALVLMLYRQQPKSQNPSEPFIQPQGSDYEKVTSEAQVSERQIAEPASGRLGLRYPAEVMAMEQTGGRLASDH